MEGRNKMTAEDLRAWQTAMAYTQQQAAEALGVSWATYKRYLVGEVPLAIGLACAALAAGLGPWAAASSDTGPKPV